jgi:hypothetical protein
LAIPLLVLFVAAAFLLRPPPQESFDEGRLFEDGQTGAVFEAPEGAVPERDRRGELAFRPISYTPWPVEAGAEGERLRLEVGPVGSAQLRTFVFSKVRWMERPPNLHCQDVPVGALRQPSHGVKRLRFLPRKAE